MRHTSASLVQVPTDPAASAHNPGEGTFNFCALREGGCTCDLGASSRSSTRSCSPLSGQWSKPADIIGRIFDAGPGIKWCAQCDVSQRWDTPGVGASGHEQTTALTSTRSTSSKAK
jgi:hypothetical protein